jgi:hypothetical protein
VTQPAGAHARSREAFALACELRARRLASGRSPKDLAGRLAIARAKIDALELGYYGSGDQGKRPGRLRREEFLRLVGSDGLDCAPEDASALLLLAHTAGAIAGGEPFRPLPGLRASDASARAAELVAARDPAHPSEAPTPVAATDAEWAPPSPRCRAFYGRARELDALVAAITDEGPPGMVLVSGFPGAGKSELVQVALRRPEVRAAFHGLRWLSARQREFLAGGGGPGAKRGVDADEVLQQLAGSLRCRSDELPSALQATRWLVVVDNTEAVVDEELLIGRLARMVGRSRIILTSRNRYRAPFLRVIPDRGQLRGIAPAEVERLFGDSGVAVSRADAERIQAVTGGAPLALHWLAGASTLRPLEELLAELEAGAPEDLYRFMFDSSWRELTAGSRDLLDFLAHQVSQPTPIALLARTHACDGEVAPAANELRQLSLVEESRAGSGALLGLHPLTAAFVRRHLRTASRWSGARETAWRDGLAYLRDILAHDRRASTATGPLGGIDNYLDWMEDALDAGAADVALITWLKLSRYLWEHWEWRAFERCEAISARASSALATTHAVAAAMLAGLSRTDAAYQAMERADFAAALTLLEEAAARFAALDDDAGRSLAHRYRGLVLLRRGGPGDLTRARDEFGRALAAIARGRSRGFPAPGTGAAAACAELRELAVWDTLIAGYAAYREDWSPGEAEIEALVAGLLLNEGRAADAVQAARTAIARYRECPHRWPGSEAAPMLTLARALVAGDRHAEARATLEEALGVVTEAERLDLKEGVLLELARLDARDGAPAQARARASAALGIATSLRQTAEIASIQAFLGQLPAEVDPVR